MKSSVTNARDADSSSTKHRYPWKWWLKDLNEPKDDAPTVFSCFACGGGSSMGYKRAGYRVLGNCEIDHKIAKVYQANLHPPMSYVMDIRDFNKLEDLPEQLYNLDVLDGSPPCSTFSMAGSREKAWGVEKQFAEGQKFQRLDDLFFVFLDTVKKLMQKVFVAENVTGLLAGNARGYVNEIIKAAKEMGYSVQIFKLNAAFMGVPQRRERVFFIGNRMNYSKLRLFFNEKPVTFGECRADHGKPFANDGTLSEVLLSKRRPTDRSLADISQRERGTYSMFNNRIISDDVPSDTIPASGVLMRMCDGLQFVTDDYRNASTFPQDYDFTGKDAHFITGMSVPPSMMANVAHEIRTQWLES